MLAFLLCWIRIGGRRVRNLRSARYLSFPFVRSLSCRHVKHPSSPIPFKSPPLQMEMSSRTAVLQMAAQGEPGVAPRRSDDARARLKKRARSRVKTKESIVSKGLVGIGL